MNKCCHPLKQILFCLSILLPLYVFPSDRSALFFEIGPTTTVKDVELYLEKLGFTAKEGSKYGIEYGKSFVKTCDSTYNEYVNISFTPKTKFIFGYHYRRYKKVSEENNEYKEDSIYFTNIYSFLCSRYGRPKEIRDSIPSVFIAKWEISTSIVDFEWNTEGNYSYGKEPVDIDYGYEDRNNYILWYQEYSSIKKREKLIENVAIPLAIVVIVLLVIWYRNKKEERKQRKIAEQARIYKQKRLEREKIEEQRIAQILAEHDEYLASLSGKYGPCGKVIKLSSERDDPYREILVYEESKHVVVLKHEFAFSEILDCFVNDNVTEKVTTETYHSPTVAKSVVNSGSLIRRGFFGDVLFGEKGAILGASTADRDIIIEGGNDTVKQYTETVHNYTVVVTVKNIQVPYINFIVGDNTQLKDEIYSLFKVIIAMH